MEPSWIPVRDGSDFPLQNLPFGIFEARGQHRRPGIRIGNFVVDLNELGLASGSSLNSVAPHFREIRLRVQNLLAAGNGELRDDKPLRERAILPAEDVRMHVPFAIGDYVDFYSSLEHATNVGKMFRDPDNPLLPNWRYLPIGYHGKAGTVQTVGHDVRRPKGQISIDSQTASYLPSRRLDIELELGYFLQAPGEIAGLVLLNDWSARDIQRWEYQPLGPFLSKSFCTSVSPWVVTLDALEPFRVKPPQQDPAPLPHLACPGAAAYDIHLEVWLQPSGDPVPVRIARTNFRHLYWTMAQQIAHLRSNGAPVRTGDLCGTGTISGSTPGSFGSLLELGWNGTQPLEFPSGRTRTFLEDGDTVILKGWCEGQHRVGFGELRTRVLPAE